MVTTSTITVPSSHATKPATGLVPRGRFLWAIVALGYGENTTAMTTISTMLSPKAATSTTRLPSWRHPSPTSSLASNKTTLHLKKKQQNKSDNSQIVWILQSIKISIFMCLIYT